MGRQEGADSTFRTTLELASICPNRRSLLTMKAAPLSKENSISMIDELKKGAAAIARPSLHLKALTDEEERVAAYWGGDGLIPCAIPDTKHWLSIDCGLLAPLFPGLGLTGVLSIYSNEEDCESGVVEFDADAKFLPPPDSLPLGAHEEISFPNLDMLLCELPGSNEPGPEEALETYERYYQAGYPFYDKGDSVFAVVGGWPIELYQGEWEDERSGWRFFLMTLRDSEPWIQVSWKNDRFVVEQRVT